MLRPHTICGDLSGHIAHDQVRPAREQIRVDTIRCGLIRVMGANDRIITPTCIPSKIDVRFKINTAIYTRTVPIFTDKCLIQ